MSHAASDVPLVCIDASVGAKWYLEDKANQAALALLEKWTLGSIRIFVPDIFFYEIGNTLSVAVRRQRLPEAAALRSLDILRRLQLETVDIRPEMGSTLAFSRRFGLSFYDAAYLAAAESRAAPLITCNKKLLGAVAPELKWVVGLAEA